MSRYIRTFLAGLSERVDRITSSFELTLVLLHILAAIIILRYT